MTFQPNKKLGQNFLKNPEIAKKIVLAADIKSSDTIIEVGPGMGILTEELVKTGAKVYSIEKDYDLAQKCVKLMRSHKNSIIVHQDALWFDHNTIAKGYKVVANIPYNITSPLIRKFIEGENKPELMVLMVQKEVAQRICAKPGDSNRGLLTIIVEYFADAEILFEVNRKEFHPQPKVDSAVIKIVVKDVEDIKDIKGIENVEFFRVVKAGFSSKRRQIHNSLAATLRLEKNIVNDILNRTHIDPKLRAEDLTVEQWRELSRNVILHISPSIKITE